MQYKSKNSAVVVILAVVFLIKVSWLLMLKHIMI